MGDGILGGTEPRNCYGGITVWLGTEGIMRVKLPEDARVAGRHASSAADAVREISTGQQRPLLLDLSGVKSVSRQARRAYGHPTTVSAYALLGAGPVDRVLAHYFLGMDSIPVPAKYFESEAEAVVWLEEYLDGT